MNEFPCKTVGCELKVSYTPKHVIGVDRVIEKQVSSKLKEPSKTVYLTCENQHVHPYRVT